LNARVFPGGTTPRSLAGPRLILASRSPQRRALLSALGVEFDVMPSGVPEVANGSPRDVALANARAKASAVAALPGAAGALVVGVDTVVSLDGRLYGKPSSAAEASRSLRALSGRVHEVFSGLVVVGGSGERSSVERTEVEFRELTGAIVRWYVESEEWRERAGGYAIQGRGAALVRGVRGDWANVVGLPVGMLVELVPELVG
jgi:septum formation protein